MKDRLEHWLSLTGQTVRLAWRHDCLGQAKAAAYSTILFFFPLLLFVVTVLVATNWFEVVVSPIVSFLPHFLPEKTQALVSDYVQSTSSKNPAHLLVLSFIMMLWTGWGLMSTFIVGVNRAYGVVEERTLLRDQRAAISLLIFASLPILAAAVIALFGSRIEALIDRSVVPLPWLWRLLRWAVVLMTMMAINIIVYYVGVHRRQRLRHVLPGAGLAAAMWIAATAVFKTYVVHFGRYDLIYGSLGGAIILFGWMYLGALAVLLGGEFNAVLDQDRRNRRPAGP